MRPEWIDRLRLPVLVAPMYLASGPELVAAACRAGVAAAFPALNPGSPEALDSWCARLEAELAEAPDAGPWGVNLILASGLYEPLLEVLARRQPRFVVTSVGAPGEVAKRVQGWGGAVLHDVTTLRHAEKAAEAGVDGIVLVAAGAGGHAGAQSPFALLPQVRAAYDGVVVLGGAIGDGRSILAAQALGADLAYMGTRFLATAEARVSDDYKAMMVACGTHDVVYTPAISGLPANFMRASIAAIGLDPAALQAPTSRRPELPGGARAWRDVWSAGHGVGAVTDLPATTDLVGRLAAEYARAAREVGVLAGRAAARGRRAQAVGRSGV